MAKKKTRGKRTPPTNNPQTPAAVPMQKHLQEAINLHKAGSLVEAAEKYAEILKNNPKDPSSLNGLGTVSLQRDQLDDAERLLAMAISQNPRLHSAYNNLATVLRRRGKLDDAASQYLKAVELKPDYHDARLNLAQTYLHGENYVDALMQAQEVVKQESRWEAYNILGVVLSRLGRRDAAEEAFVEALKLNPDSRDIYNNFAELLAERGKFQAAKQAYDAAARIAPDDDVTPWNRSLVEFKMGDLDAAYPDYEKGRIVGKRKVIDLGGEEWDGRSSLDGHLLAVQVEQGLGDELVFATCYPDVAEQADGLMITCDNRLAPAFQRLLPTAWIVPITRDERIYRTFTLDPAYPRPDRQIPAGSLPRIFRPTLADFDKTRPILIPDPELEDKWRERVSALPPGLRVGVSWRSGKLNVQRSWSYFQFHELAPLLETPGVTFVNLQYDATHEELDGIREETGKELHYWEDLDQYQDLENLIAMINQLDLVISINNASSRIASALGKGSWLIGKGGGPFALGQSRVPFFTSTVVWNSSNTPDRDAQIREVAAGLERKVNQGRG